MNLRNLKLLLPTLMITAVCGLLLASYAEHKQRRKPVHTTNHDSYASANGQWVWQNPLPQGNNLRGVSFVDATTGTVVGEYGTIVRTTDGGSSWTIQTSGTTQTLWDVTFADVNNGTAVGEDGTIVGTTDGGDHWVTQTSGTTFQLRGVSFSDATHGTAVGEGGTILRTTDGGNSWVPQSSGTGNTLFGVSF